jgi:hypothetical protein
MQTEGTASTDDGATRDASPSSVDTPMLEEGKKLMTDNPYFDFDE